MKIFTIGLAVAFCVCFAACDGNKVKDHKAKLRTINASYNAGDINLSVDYGTVYASNIQYLNFSLFREFLEGSHKVQIKNANGTVLVDTSLFMTENRHYSLFVYDSMNVLRYKVIDENFVTPTGSSCKVRFLHLSNNAPNVDVELDAQGVPMFQNFKNGLNGEYIEMGSGTRQFRALTSGAGALLTTQNPYYYKPGAFYSLFLRGNVGATGLDSLSFFVIESTVDYL
ncbi:MAG: DUF4397 domain-containing protein [Bacteroidetes bacterium]|nr:DUF4397 domain-containing protein [Bacteroidota bacterium]MBK8144969.1 DUF4397 domain-containing protein [Bacteroidota bacterium]MBP6314951.1 DUF4397 domain-containing protein [Chitinophagaceae bacterium]